MATVQQEEVKRDNCSIRITFNALLKILTKYIDAGNPIQIFRMNNKNASIMRFVVPSGRWKGFLRYDAIEKTASEISNLWYNILEQRKAEALDNMEERSS